MNTIKHIFVVCLVLTGMLNQGFGQQEPLFSQYRLNAFVLNPALAGSEAYHELRLGTRFQWQNLPGSPQTYTLSYHGRTDDNSGIGGILFSDRVGPSIRNGIQLAYAYRIPVGQPGNAGQNTLSLGFSGKVIRYNFLADRVQFVTPDDPAASDASQGLSVADASLGFFWRNEKFYAGFSIPNLIQSEFGAYVSTLPDRSVISQLARHYFLMSGYRLQYTTTAVEPSFLIRKTQGTPYQIEGTIKWYLREDRFIVGLGYRTEWLATAFFALQGNSYIIAYSGDFMLRQRRASSLTFGPSHELVLGLDIGKQWNQMFRGEDY